MIRIVSFALITTLAVTAPALAAKKGGAADTGGIKKCQDATGRWHYGDRAAHECATSEVEILNKEGVTKDTIAAPPTEAELAERERRKDEIAREQHVAEEQAKRDRILLTTYGHEDDIALVRDNKLAQLDAQIKASEETVKSLRRALERMEAQRQNEQEKNDAKALAQTEKGITQTTEQIERHEASIAQRRNEQAELRQQYERDLQRYRELKSGAPAAAAK